jgi:hypothetical protein
MPIKRTHARSPAGRFIRKPPICIEVIQEEVQVRALPLSPRPQAFDWEFRPNSRRLRLKWLRLVGKCLKAPEEEIKHFQTYLDWEGKVRKSRNVILGLWELREGKAIPPRGRLIQFCQTPNCLNPGHYLRTRDGEEDLILALNLAPSSPFNSN